MSLCRATFSPDFGSTLQCNGCMQVDVVMLLWSNAFLSIVMQTPWYMIQLLCIGRRCCCDAGHSRTPILVAGRQSWYESLFNKINMLSYLVPKKASQVLWTPQVLLKRPIFFETKLICVGSGQALGLLGSKVVLFEAVFEIKFPIS